jgi:hypothetical protein
MAGTLRDEESVELATHVVGRGRVVKRGWGGRGSRFGAAILCHPLVDHGVVDGFLAPLGGTRRLLLADPCPLCAAHGPVGVDAVIGGFAVGRRPDDGSRLASHLVEVVGGRGGESANRDALADHRGDPPRRRLRGLGAKEIYLRRPRDAGMLRERGEHVGYEFSVGVA